MSWTETDDDELQECHNRLINAQKALEAQLIPIRVILDNTVKIQTITHASYNDKHQKIITKILPKDRWGKEMTDKNRLVIKEECISKTDALLGEADG